MDNKLEDSLAILEKSCNTELLRQAIKAAEAAKDSTGIDALTAKDLPHKVGYYWMRIVILMDAADVGKWDGYYFRLKEESNRKMFLDVARSQLKELCRRTFLTYLGVGTGVVGMLLSVIALVLR